MQATCEHVVSQAQPAHKSDASASLKATTTTVCKHKATLAFQGPGIQMCCDVRIVKRKSIHSPAYGKLACEGKAVGEPCIDNTLNRVRSSHNRAPQPVQSLSKDSSSGRLPGSFSLR